MENPPEGMMEGCNSPLGRLVLADWCEEIIGPHASMDLRYGEVGFSDDHIEDHQNPAISGYGDGVESEARNGDGYGTGYGYIGCFGIGYEDGDGYGFGYPYGLACGDGNGKGDGDGKGLAIFSGELKSLRCAEFPNRLSTRRFPATPRAPSPPRHCPIPTHAGTF